MHTPSESSSAATATPVSAVELLAEKLRNAREALISKSIYLGTRGAAAGLKWQRTGRAGREDLLVTAETAAAVDEAQAAHDAHPENTPSPDISPAILSAVVLITEDDFWMTSCGMWKGPTQATPTFADVKPTCTGAAPPHEVFAADFPITCENITAIMEMGRTAGFTEVKGIKVNAIGGAPKLKFRHVLFEVHLYLYVLILPSLKLFLAHYRRAR